MLENIQLSPHFTLGELCRTSHSGFSAINQALAQKYLQNLRALCLDLLEPARAILGVPLIIHSAFRCYALNDAVGGSPKSSHLYGLAADFTPKGLDLRAAYQMLKDAQNLPYGQLILEPGWLHISLGEARQAFEVC